MNELTIFSNPEFGQIRMLEIEGKQFVVASDVTKSLGYKNASDAINKHCRWVAKRDIPHPQSPNKTLEVNIIPEGDIYRLVANSELPGAEKFERWVFDEVLPSIRKTGAYQPQQLTRMQILELAIAAEKKVVELELTINEQKPKVLLANSITASKKSILIGELAKIIKQNGVDIGQNRLFEWLRTNGYLGRKNGDNFNLPTQKSMDMELFEIKKTAINCSDGIRIERTAKVTGKGQAYFVNKFLNKSLEVTCQ